MDEPVVFTIRLTSRDWDPNLRAWRCPALEIPGASIHEAFDPKGQPLAATLLKIDRGPARVSWKGAGQPSQIAIVIGLGEELAPTSEGRFWRRLAIVIPIITAIIGAFATYISGHGLGPEPAQHLLRLRVEPNEVEGSGLAPAKIFVNSRELSPPIEYKISSDVIAIVDVNKAVNQAKSLSETYQNQSNIVTAAIAKFDSLFSALNDLNRHVNGDICSGGSAGTPSPVRSNLSSETAAISDGLRLVSSDLKRALSGSVPNKAR